MRKEELIKQVAESTGIAICEVRTVIEAALKETVDAVANGRTLYIRGFGTLSPKHYKRKVARNIHKNETIVIAECRDYRRKWDCNGRQGHFKISGE